jgi:hypothetical protein
VGSRGAAEARHRGQELNGAAQRIAPELRACRPEHDLDTLRLAGICKRKILIRPGAERRVVEADSVDQVQDLIAGEAAEEG